jgi:CHASE3 domain sensor protein
LEYSKLDIIFVEQPLNTIKMENQGRRKDQIEFSERVAFWSIVAIIVTIASILILNS